MPNPQTHYQSYLLRLWRSSAHRAWRGSLQSTATGETHDFHDLASLLVYLVAQLDEREADVVLGEVVTNLQKGEALHGSAENVGDEE